MELSLQNYEEITKYLSLTARKTLLIQGNTCIKSAVVVSILT